MKCSVFIAASTDGFIATEDGGVEWLDTAGDPSADMENFADTSFADFMSTVDCMVMGRNTMEKLSSFNLSDEQWPYGDTRIIVLSNTIKTPPENLRNRVEIYSGTITNLVSQLEQEGYRHAYIDGGATITAFINAKLITDMCITQIPILLGSGIRLFGEISPPIHQEEVTIKSFPNGFVQIHSKLHYSRQNESLTPNNTGV